MFSAAVAFVAGFLLTWPALIAFVLLGILFEHNGARGWAVASALAVMAVSYFFFSIPLMTLGLGALGYIVLGLIWSFYRYKRHALKVVEDNKNKSDREKQVALTKLHPSNMWDSIMAWVLIWPFSLIENFVGDIINAIQMLVQKVFRGVYHRIYDSAVKALTGN
jgi:hypothetical protein